MDTLISMQVFRLVAELKSFVAASRRLGLSPAMTSKHVWHLEARLGSRLLNRTSRSVSLTEAGRLYLEKVSPLLDGLDEAQGLITQAANVPKGTLRISAPVWVASGPFVAVLADYRSRYPQVMLDIDLSGRLVSLVDEGFDLALRVSRNPGDQYIARTITEVEFGLVATPAYLAKAGTPQRLADFADHQMLWYAGVPESVAVFGGARPGGPSVPIKPVMRSHNESLLHLAALNDMGIAALPNWLAREDLATGRLVPVLGAELRMRSSLQGLYPSRKFLSSKVRSFLDFLCADERLKLSS